MSHIYYLPDEKLVPVDDTETILETSLCAGIPHTHVCGGSARCSTCRVWVLEGLEHCAPRNDAEQALAKQLRFDPKIRLACQTQIVGEGQITLRRLAIDAEDLELISLQMSGRSPLTAIGQEQHIAILFADLRGFTMFSESLPAYDVIYVLNRYFRRMGQVIGQHGGVINNYMGDGLMALFGCNQAEGAAEQAVRAGLAMQVAMEDVNVYLHMLYHQRLQIGIGIHYGSVVIGTVGASPQSQQFTAIGDAVNFASRIEAANKIVGTTLLMSEETYQAIAPLVTVTPYPGITIPGKSGDYTLYEVIEIQPPQSPSSTALALATAPKLSRWSWLNRLMGMVQRVWRSLRSRR